MDILANHCIVCDSSSDSELNRCRRCRKTYHRRCYPIMGELCDYCLEVHTAVMESKKGNNKKKIKEIREKQVKCFICEETDPPLFKKISKFGDWAHVMCYVASPIVKLDSFETLQIALFEESEKKRCQICHRKSQHLLKCQLCDFYYHHNCIYRQQDEQDQIERHYIGNDLSKFKQSKALLQKIATGKYADLFEILGGHQKQKKQKDLVICEHHLYQQFCWCFCGNSALNNEETNPSVICDGCQKYVHLSCSGLSSPDSKNKYYCPGCQENDIFRKNIQLPHLLEELIKVQKSEKINEYQIKLMRSMPFNYSVKLEKVIENNIEAIADYYLKQHISTLLENQRNLLASQKLYKLTKYLLNRQKQDKGEGQPKELGEKIVKNVQQILSNPLYASFHLIMGKILKSLRVPSNTSSQGIHCNKQAQKPQNNNPQNSPQSQSARQSPTTSIENKKGTNDKQDDRILKDNGKQQCLEKTILESIATISQPMTPDSQIFSIIHKIRKTLHENENREMLNKFKHEIEKLEQYQEYHGSIFTVLCAIPVDKLEIDQLITHFCQIRQNLKTGSVINKQYILELSQHSYLVQALGFQNYKYLKAVRDVFKRYLKKLKGVKENSQMKAKSLLSIVKSFSLHKQNRFDESQYPESYESFKLEDILYLDEEAVRFQLVCGIKQLGDAIPPILQKTVEMFLCKMRLMFQLICIQHNLPYTLSTSKKILKNKQLTTILNQSVQNFQRNKKRYREILWSMQEVFKSKVPIVNGEIRSSVDLLSKKIQKMFIEEDKLKDTSVLSTIWKMKTYFGWPTFNIIDKKMQELKQIIGPLQSITNIQNWLQNEEKVIELLDCVEDKLFEQQNNCNYPTGEMDRLDVLAQWCSVSLRLNCIEAQSQPYTIYSIQNFHEIMKEISYPNNKIFKQIKKLYKICKPLIDLYCCIVKPEEPQLENNMSNMKTKFHIDDFRYKLEEIKKIEWNSINVMADLEIMQLEQQIKYWKDLNDELEMAIKDFMNTKTNKTNDYESRFQNADSNTLYDEYLYLHDLKQRIENSPIKIASEIKFRILQSNYRMILGKFKAADQVQKKTEAFRFFWSNNSDKIMQVIPKKPNSSRKQWVDFIPFESKTIKAICTRLIGPNIAKFQKYYDEYDRYIIEIQQLRKRALKENSTVDINRLKFLKAAFGISMFNHGKTIGQDIDKFIEQFETTKQKVQTIVPYLLQIPRPSAKYPDKIYLHNNEVIKSLRKIPIRDIVTTLYEQDYKAYHYLKDQFDSIERQQQILNPSKSPNIDGYVNFSSLAKSVDERQQHPIQQLALLQEQILTMSEYLANACRHKIGVMISTIYKKILTEFSQVIDTMSVGSIQQGKNYMKKIYEHICQGWFRQYIEQKHKEAIWNNMNNCILEVEIYLRSLQNN